MVERKRIGLFLESYRTFPSIVIYILNIIRTCVLIDDNKKPIFVILHKKDSPLEELKEFKYPYLEFYELKDVYSSLPQRLVNKISRKILGKNLIPFVDNGFPKDLDCIFPYSERAECNYIKHKIIWKPDFQEFHYPVYFSPSDLDNHTIFLDRISKLECDLILSSDDSKRDYERYYPSHANKIKVVNFTSFLPPFDHINISQLKGKLNISRPYFLVANQFWPHKNHINVLKAMSVVKRRLGHMPFQMVFTGKTSSDRDKDLKKKLDYYIHLNQLNEDVIYTGFINREDQLALMKNSIAVVQPSLFEGWSIVIEDVKAMNHRVIASSISVNKEQIIDNACFFNPFDFKELAERMLSVFETPAPIIVKDYSVEINKFKEHLELVFEL
jgi:glycosyltransferase involved in cell wall biosynthesis